MDRPADVHPALLAPDWPAPARVHGLATLRHGAGGSAAPFDHFNLGSRCGDDPAAVIANRAELARIADLPSAPAWLRQVHGTGVVEVREPPVPGAAEPEADAAVTGTPGVVLAILTADCLPVLLCDRDGTRIGAAHAGWRGLAAGVLEATVTAMQVPAASLIAWLGPAAGPQRYEVGAEVRDAFLARDPGAATAFTAIRPDHWHVDLYALARQRLEVAGVPADAIHGGGLCTIGDEGRFFSHRRDGRGGRMATLAWIAPSHALA